MTKIAMTPFVQRVLTTLCILCLIVAGSSAFAAAGSKNFKRLSFDTQASSKLSVESKGTNVTLRFTSPIKESAASVQAKLGSVASAVTLSRDGKTLTLTMDKPYRIRQFTGSDGPGIDLVGVTPEKSEKSSTKKEAKAAPAATITSTKKPEPDKKKSTTEKSSKERILTTKPSAKEDKKKKQQATKKSSPKTTPAASVKQPASPKEKVTSATPQAPAAEYSTKEKPAASTPLMATAETIPTEKQAAAPITSTKAPNPDEDQPDPPPTKPNPSSVPEKPTAAPTKSEEASPRASPHKPGEKLVVSAQRTGNGTVINFPWRERTAAAVFERSRTIWIVFSRPVDVNLPLLRTVLPKPIIEISQFQYPQNTVIRIVTDGTIHAAASMTKGNYDWNVTLSTAITPAKVDVPIKADTAYATRQLVLGAFDVSEPLRFYDPMIGDLLVVIPAYEEGRGIIQERNFPELSLLSTNQGITVVSRQPSLKTQLSRVGVTLYVEGGLQISELLPSVKNQSSTTPEPTSLTPAEVMFPYDQWYVPQADFAKERQKRLSALVNSSRTSKPDSLFSLVTLYLGQGMAMEAQAYLKLIEQEFPDYYRDKKLALIHTATYLMNGWIDEARQAIARPELADVAEAGLWREVVTLYTPPATAVDKLTDSQKKPDPATAITAKPASPPPSKKGEETRPDLQLSASPVSNTPGPVFQFLKHNRSYIHFYPPRIRQYLVRVAADAYIRNGEPEKALAAYDTLSREGIIGLLNSQAQYALVLVAIDKKEIEQAQDTLKRLLSEHRDSYIWSRARYTKAILDYNEGKVSPQETAEALEKIRFSWRGDALERKLLDSLVKLYTSMEQYDNVLRTWKAILDGFPSDPDTLTISASMGELFTRLYLYGLADNMTPLQSLSLFFEFRDLTPVGPRGDEIIRKLADRLAAFDLLDRATQLLEHQVRFRVNHEERSRVGARLALLHLLNNQPQQALNVLQITNFGNNPPELARQRLQISAEALNKMGKHEEALGMITSDSSPIGNLLRLEILWNMQDWPNVVNSAEDILAQRPNLTTPLTPQETEILLKLAVAYSFEGDNNQLRYLRDYYAKLIPETAYKQIFDFITNDTTPLDPADISMVAQQISNTENFLNSFRSKIAEGKLSEAIQ